LNEGTHVAGVIVASTNNSLGIAGFAFNVKLWIGKVLNSGNTGFYSDFAACIDDATDAGVDIISLSLVVRTNREYFAIFTSSHEGITT
jgi:thermitase